MTAMSRCLDCGIRIVGVMRQCPDCKGERMVQYTRPTNCSCGLCEVAEVLVDGARGVFAVARCAGTGVEVANGEMG